MPKSERKLVRKDLVCVENIKVYTEKYMYKGKQYYRSVMKLPNFLNEGNYDMILIPKKIGIFRKETKRK